MRGRLIGGAVNEKWNIKRERWGSRGEATVGGKTWPQLNSRTFFFGPSAAVPLSKPHIHTYTERKRERESRTKTL